MNSSRFRELAPLGIGVFMIVFSVGIAVMLVIAANTYRPTPIMVTSLRWERRLIIEIMRALYQDTSVYTMPSDAYNIAYYTDEESYPCTEIHFSTPEIKTCWRTVSKARYWINRWQYSEIIRASGGKRDEMADPLYSPVGDGIALDSTRIARREADYIVGFKCGDESLVYITSDSTLWQSLVIEGWYQINRNLLGSFDWQTLKAAE